MNDGLMRACLSKFILACTDAGDDSTIDEQIGACDKTGMLTQQEGCCLGNLVTAAFLANASTLSFCKAFTCKVSTS